MWNEVMVWWWKMESSSEGGGGEKEEGGRWKVEGEWQRPEGVRRENDQILLISLCKDNKTGQFSGRYFSRMV